MAGVVMALSPYGTRLFSLWFLGSLANLSCINHHSPCMFTMKTTIRSFCLLVQRPFNICVNRFKDD